MSIYYISESSPLVLVELKAGELGTRFLGLLYLRSAILAMITARLHVILIADF